MEDEAVTPKQQPPPPPPPQHPLSEARESENEPISSPLSLGSVESSQQNLSAAVTAVTGRSESSLVTPNTSSWSTSSDYQLGHGASAGASADRVDRVFPVRSVVSVDPTGHTAGQTGYFPRAPAHSAANVPPHRPSQPPLDTQAARSTTASTKDSASQSASTPVSVLSPPGSSRRSSRYGTVTGPFSSVQADVARQENAVHIPLFSSDMASEKSEESAAREGEASATGSLPLGSDDAGMDPGFVTFRFSHVVTEDGHAVMTGRDGVLQRCEDEPIHTPGAVQAFGLILSLKEEQSGQFIVQHVSENSEQILGYTPRQLFGLDNFLDILSEEQQDNLLDHIDFVRDEDADPAVNGPEVFGMSIKPPKKRRTKLWCAMHISATHPDLIICEFELEDDTDFPLRPPEDMTPNMPEDTLHSNPTLEELTESTEILSKPLRVLRSARKQRGEAGAMQVFDIMSQVQEQLSSAPNLEVFLKILVGIVKELTGFHRVMVYQFDSSFNGKVVTELVDAKQTLDLYKGLNFPASDIPKQARDLYKLNRVRLLYDRDQETARLVCRSKEDAETPLDMSHAYLRAMSPIHLKYLANMAVRSSMSISINAFNELWGLIACHSYGPRGMRVSFPIRKMCRLVGDTASRNIERLSYASRLQARKLINMQPTHKNPSGYIIASSDDLLRLFDADFGMLSIQGETKSMGKLEHSQEALAMLEYLRLRKFTAVTVVHDIRTEFRDLRYAPGFSIIAGLLYVPLSVGGSDFIVFCRKGQVKEVKWAGNPYDKTVRAGTADYLEPRTSFGLWRETVLGKCREWSDEHVETAAVLCLVYGKFIEVWRRKEAALQSSRLTRLLLANSAHEVRTPLNAIINYLEIALEGTLDQETRDNLAKSHSASKSLIYVINDLLDLTKTEEGKDLVEEEIFDLQACIREAAEPFAADAKRKGIKYEMLEHPGLPRMVFGDGRRVRQAVSNICANAFQHTTNGFVKVESYVTEVQDKRIRVEIAVADSGAGMSAEQLDNLFRDLEQVEEASKASPEASGKPPAGRLLGLGLAMVARIVRNMDGQLRLRSREGKGSRFVMQLPFEMPGDSPNGPDDSTAAGAGSTAESSVASVTTTLPAAHIGEITLVASGSSSSMPTIAESATERALDETYRPKSHGTGSSKSDTDRLFGAINAPLAYNPPEPEYRPDASSRMESMRRQSGSKRSMSPASIAKWRDRAGPSHVEMPGSEAGFSPAPRAKSGAAKAAKIPDDYFDSRPSSQKQVDMTSHPPAPGQPPIASMATIDERSKPGSETAASTKLQVLIAEDDPINFKVLQKRLKKAGNEVHHAANGQDCATAYRDKSPTLDVILMDMQVRTNSYTKP